MATWKRWLKYAKAKVESATRAADADLDRREATLEAERAERPWLADDRPSPSFDDVRARVEGGQPARPGRPASGDAAFDLAARERDAAARLAEMRESLGLDDEPER